MKQRYTTPYEKQRLWLYAAVSLLMLSISLYIYLISASVHHVVMRKDIDQQIVILNSKVSELESSYIEAQHALSVEIASAHGFVHTNQKVFIDRTKPSLVFSGN